MDGELCAYCGKDDSVEPLTREHFVPRGLWDGERPSLTKTVPVHDSCNRKYSDDNEYFRDVLVMEAGAKKHPEVKKLHSGKIRRKMRRRIGSIKNTLKDLVLVPVVTESGIFVGNAPAFRVDWDRMKRVVNNVMRGIYYTLEKTPLPSAWKVCLLRDEEIDHGNMQDLFGQMVPNWENFGDDVFGCRYWITGDSIATLMQFYRRRTFLGVAWSRELYDSLERHFMTTGMLTPS